jgi:hypothetical protein
MVVALFLHFHGYAPICFPWLGENLLLHLPGGVIPGAFHPKCCYPPPTWKKRITVTRVRRNTSEMGLILDTAPSGKPIAGAGIIQRCIPLLALFATCLSGCSPGLRGNSGTAPAWETGFWLWPGSYVEAAAARAHPFDVLYVQIGRIDSYYKNSVSWRWPLQMPPAAEYWALWRYDGQARPTEAQIAVIASDFHKRQAEAATQGNGVVGIQLDYDCPTADLPEYASFLGKVRKALPEGTRISITALLDWFRPSTRVGDVLVNTSEFVPQFYDVAPSSRIEMRGIAEPIDPARWGPVFNSFGVPYRVGISTFGRILFIHNGATQFFRDLTPLDVFGHPGLTGTSTGQTTAGEQQSVWRVDRATRLNYWPVKPGDEIEVIMPTRHSVLSTYDAAKQMGGFCAGVIFFRWPSAQETLVLNPAQVLSWITHTEIAPTPPAIEVNEGDCVAVHCWDLQLRIANRLPEHAVTFLVHASRPLEYFLPDQRITSRVLMTGPATIKVVLPASHGVGTLYLGRAVTLQLARFTVTEEK